MNEDKILKFIQSEEKKGNIVVQTFEGAMSCDLGAFLEQPTEGILYDLNRDKVTTLACMSESRWINDYAVAVVITALKK